MKRPECEKYDQLIYGYAEGSLDPDQAAELEAHLAGCAECSAKLAEAKTLLEAIKESAHEPPPEILSGVMAAVAEDKKKKRATNMRVIRRLGAAAAALIVVVGVAASLRLTDKTSSAPEEKEIDVPQDNQIAGAETPDNDNAYYGAPTAGDGDFADAPENYAEAPADGYAEYDGVTASGTEAPPAAADPDGEKNSSADDGSDASYSVADGKDAESDKKASNLPSYTADKVKDPGAALMNYGAAYVIAYCLGE